jgi:hypothetical protein
MINADENAVKEATLAEEKRMAEEKVAAEAKLAEEIAAEEELLRPREEKSGEEDEEFVPHESITSLEAMLENALNAELNFDLEDTSKQTEQDDTNEEEKQGALVKEDSVSRMEEMLERALLDDLEIDFTQETEEEAHKVDEAPKPKPKKALPKKVPAPKSRNILANKKMPVTKAVTKPITRAVTTRSKKSAAAKPHVIDRKSPAARKTASIRSTGSPTLPRVAMQATASSAAKTVDSSPSKVPSGSKEHHVASITPPRSRQRKSKPKPAKLFSNSNSTRSFQNSSTSFDTDGQHPKGPYLESKSSAERPGTGVLDDTFQPYIHGEKSPCELCYFLLSPDEKAICDIHGRHLRVVMSTGGCDRSCCVFPRAPNEPPVRLCRTCFFNTHRITYQKVAPKRRILRN